MIKIFTLIFVLWFPTFLYAQDYSHDSNVDVGVNSGLCPEFFQGTLLDIKGREVLTLCRVNYAVIYDVNCKIPLLTFENLTMEDLIKNVDRRDNFTVDPSLYPEHSANLLDYMGSGYDRGHMVPANNSRIDSLVMDQSFYLSNMIPQSPGANRGDWREIEDRVYEIVEMFDTQQIYVITGSIVTIDPKMIGDNNVCVPKAMFKSITTESHDYQETYVMINKNPQPNRDDSFYQWSGNILAAQGWILQ